MSVPVNLEIFMTDLTRAGLASVGKNVDDAEGQTRRLIAALEEVRAECQRVLEANRRAGQSYAQEQANVQALTGQINGLKEGLKELEAAKQQTNATPLIDTDAVARKTDNLRMQFQQVARELPSLAMGPQMFILAISNNLPMLADAIADVRKQNELLKASGQKSAPVWKQLGGALLSWQTALVAGISLLIVYGDEIAKWVGNLFKGEKQVNSLAERMKTLNSIQREAGRAAAKERSELDVLYKATQDHTRSLQERNAAADELQKRYPKYFENLSNEAILAGNASGAYKQLTENILKAAQARAAQDKITKNYERMFQLQRAINADTNWTNRNREKTQSGTATRPVDVVTGIGSLAVQQLTDDAIEYNRRIEALKKNQEELKRLAKDNDYYAGLIDMESLTEDHAQQSLKEIEQAKSYLDDLSKLHEDNEKREVDLMKEGTEKQLAEIELRYRREKEAIIDQQRDLAEANATSGITSTNANGLTDDQQSEIDRANELASESRKKQIEEVYRAEADAMRTYLSEYGTFQQRKLAIAQEYADKIARAQTDGDRLSLEKERDRKLSGMEAEALRMSIDWPSVFGEFGGMFNGLMRPTLEQVKQYMQTDDFKNLQPTDQSKITEAVNRLEQSLGGAGKVSFNQLGKEVQTLQKSMRDLNDAKQQEAEAMERLAEAQEAYEQALSNGTDNDKAAADLRLSAAKDEADAASENVRKQEEIANQNNQIVTGTATTLRANMENVTQGLQQLASGGIQAAYEGLLKLAKGSGNDKMGQIADKLEDVFIIGWIIQIIDVFKDGLSNVVEGLLDGIFNAVGGILNDVLSGDLFVTIGNSIMKGVGNIFDAITFGGFSHWGNNVAETKATIDRLTTRNEALIDSIDRLNDTMQEARGAETVKKAEEMMKLQQEVNENYRDIAAARAHYQGKHHSWSKYFNDWLDGVMGNPNFDTGHNDWETYQRMNEIAGFQIKSRTDFLSISPEQMAEMLAIPDIRQLLEDIGEGGYGAKMVATLEDYAEQAGKLEEIEAQLNETLTQISFDSLYDSFIDTLMDMDASAEDFADNFSKYMMQAVLSNQVGELLYDDLEAWYKKFGEAMKDGSITEDLSDLRQDWDDIVNKGLALRDVLAAATGYDLASKDGTSQSPQSGALTTMTQDSISTFEGIGRSLQTHIISLDKVTQELRDQNRADSESLMQIVQNTSYLQPIYELMEKMDRDGIKIQ